VTGRGGAWVHLPWTSFKGRLPVGKDLSLEVPPLGSFYCTPRFLEIGGGEVKEKINKTTSPKQGL